MLKMLVPFYRVEDQLRIEEQFVGFKIRLRTVMKNREELSRGVLNGGKTNLVSPI